MKHPNVRDLGLRQGIDGVGSPSDYVAAEALVQDAMERVIANQLRTIAELQAEVARLRGKQVGR